MVVRKAILEDLHQAVQVLEEVKDHMLMKVLISGIRNIPIKW